MDPLPFPIEPVLSELSLQKPMRVLISKPNLWCTHSEFKFLFHLIMAAIWQYYYYVAKICEMKMAHQHVMVALVGLEY